jgi:hypothetical protein
MYQRLFVAVLFIGVLHNVANASAEAAIPFQDGRWSGGMETGSNSNSVGACWARTTLSDGTMFALAKLGDGTWHLRLSNPGWRLPPSRRYAMKALVDFYPQLRVAAEAKSPSDMEIANIDRTSLLGLIENGHTINLDSDGFNVKYDLEGSAKAIERVRKCFID